MLRNIQPLRFFVATLLCVGLSPAAQSADVLQPHEAIYDLTINEWKLGAPPASFSGSGAYRLGESCDDWTTNFNLSIKVNLSGGPTLDIELEVKQVEARDGTGLMFHQVTKRGGRVQAENIGTVKRAGPGAAGTITWRRPVTKTKRLPSGVLFQAEAFFNSRDAINRGEKIVSYSLFDGSSDQPAQVLETLTRLAKDEVSVPAGDADLVKAKAWRVVGSLVTEDKPDSAASTSFVNVSHTNGVFSFQRIDVGFASFDLRLQAIKALPKPVC